MAGKFIAILVTMVSLCGSTLVDRCPRSSNFWPGDEKSPLTCIAQTTKENVLVKQTTNSPVGPDIVKAIPALVSSGLEDEALQERIDPLLAGGDTDIVKAIPAQGSPRLENEALQERIDSLLAGGDTDCSSTTTTKIAVELLKFFEKLLDDAEGKSLSPEEKALMNKLIHIYLKPGINDYWEE